MLYLSLVGLICTTITSVDLAHYGVSQAKDWVSVDCGTNKFANFLLFLLNHCQTYFLPEKNAKQVLEH